MKSKTTEIHIEDLIEEKARTDSGFAIAYALLVHARAKEKFDNQMLYLLFGDASGPVGSIEAFGLHIGKKIDDIFIEIKKFSGANERQ